MKEVKKEYFTESNIVKLMAESNKNLDGEKRLNDIVDNFSKLFLDRLLFKDQIEQILEESLIGSGPFKALKYPQL